MLIHLFTDYRGKKKKKKRKKPLNKVAAVRKEWGDKLLQKTWMLTSAPTSNGFIGNAKELSYNRVH